jgi:tRNA threonylcarbamoyladenosine biosynthesis protein TsaB
MNKIILYIDTANEETRVSIFRNSRILNEKKWNGHGDLSVSLLREIDSILLESKIHKGDLDEVVVNKGPGSYTGLRIGITVANFLAWSLKIEVFAGKIENGKLSITGNNKNKYILPKYFRQAHITRSKKKFNQKA